MRFGIRDHSLQEAVQSFLISIWNLEDTLVSRNDQHLPGGVIDRIATAATAQMPLDLLAHLDRGFTIQVSREIGDYRFAANPGSILSSAPIWRLLASRKWE
jgi:hypothetical protein